MIHIFKYKVRERRAGAQRRANAWGWLLGFVFCLASLTSFGCAAPTTNTNATMNTNATASATANTNATPTGTVSSAAFAMKEPEQYSLTMSVTGQGSAGSRQGTLPPQTVEFARLGADRRWALTLPAVGQVVYLEKPAMRYLILPSRSQYVELTPDALGFQMGNVMTPSAIVEQLRPRTQHEVVGTEVVNGRPATKYRFAGAADTRTQAGTVQTESFVFLDEATGLPLRADLNFASTSGGSAQGTIETRDINLNPAPTLFEVPTGYKKMTGEELKQQVQGFIQFIRVFAPAIMQQQGGATPPPPTPTPSANTNRPANANR